MKQLLMSSLLVEDLDISKETIFIIKQISRGNYCIDSTQGVLDLSVFFDNEKKKYSIILDDAKISSFITILIHIEILSTEPSIIFLKEYFKKKTIGQNPSISDCLTDFFTDHVKYGDHFSNNTYYKIYSNKPITDEMREEYGATWIDYEEQLKNGNVIFDKNNTNGLWAMPLNVFKICINNSNVLNRYGDKFFIVRTLENCKYIENEKEIIGAKFEVLEQHFMSEAEKYINNAFHY